MCGITGIFNTSGEPVNITSLKKMTEGLSHRGPDGEGLFTDGVIGLGHRRLAILDTTENGAQPMKSKNGQWVVVFNGCIYNYLEIKAKLINKGHTFISGTDTEVI